MLRQFLLAALVTLAAAPAPVAAQMSAGPQDYRVGPGDVLRIAAFQSPELSLDAQVSESGKISYPLAGVVDVAGQSPFEIGRLLERKLREGGYFKAPQINVLVADYRAKVVSVEGQVSRPGRYPLDRGSLRLSEILALAGGALPTGADDVVVLRDGRTGPERLTVNLATLFNGRETADLLVMPGDRVFVDKAPRMYVRGEVQRPGEFQITAGLTVGQALAVAGGVTQRGNEGNVDIFRVAANGARQKINAQRGDIVRPGDEIVVRERVF